MGRYGFLVAFLVVLLAPFVGRAFMLRGTERAELDLDAALELRILTPHNQDIRNTFARAFVDWHQREHGSRVRVVFLTPGGTLDIVRYLTDVYRAERDPKSGKLRPEAQVTPHAELVWGGGDTTFDRELKPFLKPVALPDGVLAAAFPQAHLNGIPLFEPSASGAAPRWIGVVLSSFGIIYAPELYQRLGLPTPRTWSDLARPELAGLVALTDPTRSGSAAVAYVMVLQRAMADAEEQLFRQRPELQRLLAGELASVPEYQKALAAGWKQGMRTLLLIAANARYFTDQAGQTCNDVGNGEAAAALAIDFYARVFEEQVGPSRLRYWAPREATAVTPDPIGVLYGTVGAREVLANRFIEFLLTVDGQRLWNLRADASPYVERSLRRLPIRRDVYADRKGFADDVDPFALAGDFNLRPEWMQQFRELRMLWAAAWIDTREALVEAYASVRRVSDPKRRERLLHSLSDIPVELGDAVRLSRERRALESGPPGAHQEDPRLWAARTRLDWDHRFREHYRAVGEEASTPR